MTIALAGLDSVNELEIVVNGEGGANRLFIYTGVAMCSFKGTGGEWRRDTLAFDVGRVFQPGQFVKASASGALAAVRNDHTAVNAGWACDRVRASRGSNGKTHVEADLAVSDSDGYVLRIAYEVHVLAKL